MSGNPQKKNIDLQFDANAITGILPLLLRRLVRLLVGAISFPVLVDMLRSIYVGEGKKKLERSGSKPTKSALALITGLDTRVVSSILRAGQNPSLTTVNVNPELALIDLWNSDPFFQNPETEKAAILPIEGRGKTFQGLVLRAIGRNITNKTVLDKLLDGGTIRVIQGDTEQVELISKVYFPISSDYARSLEVGLLESSRVLSAVIHNIQSEPEARVPQQGRWTYRLDPKDYLEFRKKARALLEKQIKEGDELLEEYEQGEKQSGQLTVGIGWYQWGDHYDDNDGE